MAQLVAGMFVDGDPAQPYVRLDEPALVRVLEATLPKALAEAVLKQIRDALISAARKA